jgi:CRP-like cAMP-binding protein
MPRTARAAFATVPTADREEPYSPGDDPVARRSIRCAPYEEIPELAHAFEPNNLFLKTLPPAELARLRPHLVFNRLPQGLVLHEAGQKVEQVHFLDSGMVSLVATMQDGAQIETATLGRESMLGSLSALGEHRAGTRAIVQIDATSWRLPAADFRAAVAGSAGLSRMVLASHELTLAQMQQTAACNALHSADRRLCRWIVQVRDRLDDDVIRLTHDFLAQMLAVRRPTVSLIAYRLQQAGLIRYQRGKITILDRAGLERGACECVGALREKTQKIIGGVG